MSGLLTGFMGGFGKGASNFAKTLQVEKATKERDERNHQWDVEKEQRTQEFQTERDDKLHERDMEKTEAEKTEKREYLRWSVDFTRKHGEKTVKDAQEALAKAGNDFAKAAAMAPTPEAQKAIMEMGEFAQKGEAAKSKLAVDKASIRSSDASAMKSAADAKHVGSTAAAEKSGEWKPYVEKDQYGEDKPVTHLISGRTGELKPINKPKGTTADPLSTAKKAFASGMTLEQINAQAKAKGLPGFTKEQLRGGAQGGW